MEVRVTGKQMDVGDALKTHVTEKLENIDNKYFNRAFGINVTFAPEGQAFVKCYISLKVGKDITVTAHEVAPDAYISFDAAANKIAKQLRRYKKRLRDHHEKPVETPEAEMTKARDYMLAMNELDHAQQDEEDADHAAGDDPLIVAETSTQIQKLSVSDAAMRLDLSGQCAILFRNPKTNILNMLYKRTDGNIGWVEPADVAQAPSQQPPQRPAANTARKTASRPAAKPAGRTASKPAAKSTAAKSKAKPAKKTSAQKPAAKKAVKKSGTKRR